MHAVGAHDSRLAAALPKTDLETRKLALPAIEPETHVNNKRQWTMAPLCSQGLTFRSAEPRADVSNISAKRLLTLPSSLATSLQLDWAVDYFPGTSG